MKRYFGKKVLVVGLAKSGIAAARLLLREGAHVAVTESADTPEIRRLAGELGREKNLRVEIGGHTEAFCEGAQIVVTSPGIPETALPLQWAEQRRISVVSELELGAQFTKVLLVAVTGSNGKTTTTTLIAELLRAAGKKARACGNIGTPLSEIVLGKEKWDALVVEASSFQLERIETFRPHVAVLMNLTQNHLDRHKTFEAYAGAKLRIFENQTKKDWAIFREAEASIVKLYGPKMSGTKVKFQLGKGEIADGAYLSSAEVRAHWKGEDLLICPLSEIKLFGRHNLENILAAANVALIFGVKKEAIRQVLSRFTGVEHRLEKVRTLDGILFVNDSKATSVDAVICALASLQSVVWIAGGRDKGSDFSPLAGPVREKVRAAVLLGEAKEKIEKAVHGVVPCVKRATLEGAVQAAFESARPGDTVLLSPGCASFDMFLNYEDRGEKFKKAVHALVSKNKILV